MPNFDPGYTAQPFLTLCDQAPDQLVYDPKHFRIEWGPIFHRGRLDGSARVLVIGQDPAAHETFVRRILVGEAGARAQGFLGKLGISTSYVMINTFVYSVFGKGAQDTASIAAYRNQWIDALLASGKIQGVVTLGALARTAWQTWVAHNNGALVVPHDEPITHPTEPESAAASDPTKTVAGETQKLLVNWNAALGKLKPFITSPDVANPASTNYAGPTWQAGDRVPAPAIDFPAGLPDWMRTDGWAQRVGGTVLDKRRNLTLTIPTGIVP
jgi:hypothetical protein